jgi:hypothetical protein
MSAAGSFFKAVCSAFKVLLLYLAAGDKIVASHLLVDVLLVAVSAMVEKSCYGENTCES